MSPQNEDVPASERVALLERKAKVVRSRLLRAVEALDARRHQVVQIGQQAKAMAKPAIISLLGIAALIGVGAFALGAAFRARRRAPFSKRLSAGVSHTLDGIERARQPPLARRVFEKVTLTVVSLVATELAKRATRNLADGRLLDGRLAVGKALDRHHAALALPHGAGR